jgi:hypothetical protein
MENARQKFSLLWPILEDKWQDTGGEGLIIWKISMSWHLITGSESLLHHIDLEESTYL